MAEINWQGIQNIASRSYRCSHCGQALSSDKGYRGDRNIGNRLFPEYICICHFCQMPTYIDAGEHQYPGVSYGNAVSEIEDEDVKTLYEEARRDMAVNSYSSAVMACRKILMHLAVAKGAKKNQSFKDYVDFLSSNGFVPPDGRGWVDHIRDIGNDANHEIKIIAEEDAKELLDFTEGLLVFIYRFPAKFKKAEERRKNLNA